VCVCVCVCVVCKCAFARLCVVCEWLCGVCGGCECVLGVV